MTILQKKIKVFHDGLSEKDKQSVILWDDQRKIDICNHINYINEDRKNILMMYINLIEDDQLIATMIFSGGVYFHHYKNKNLKRDLTAAGTVGAIGGAVAFIVGAPIILTGLLAYGLYKLDEISNNYYNIKDAFFEWKNILDLVLNKDSEFVLTLDNNKNETIIFKADLAFGQYANDFRNKVYKLYKNIIAEKNELNENVGEVKLDNLLPTLFSENKWNKILSSLEEHLSNGGEFQSHHYIYKAIALNGLKKWNLSLVELNKFEKLLLEVCKKKNFYELDDEISITNYGFHAFYKANNLLNLNEIITAHWYFNIADKFLTNEEKNIVSVNFEKDLETSYKNFSSSLLNSSYSKRKLIVPVTELPPVIPDNIVPVKIGYTSPIKFYSGEALKGEIYIGHPHNNEYYLINDSEDQFLESQVNELTYLLQCLGAKEISIRKMHENKIHEKKAEKTDDKSGESNQLNISANTIIHEGKFEKGGKSLQNENKSAEKDSYSVKLKNMENYLVQNPVYKPFIPDGLIWFPYMNTWQSIARSRFTGNVLRQKTTISSNNLKQISSEELNSIESELESMIDIGYKNFVFGGEISKKSDVLKTKVSKLSNSLRESENIFLEIDVIFAPVNDLTIEFGKEGKNLGAGKKIKNLSEGKGGKNLSAAKKGKSLIAGKQVKNLVPGKPKKVKSKIKKK